MTMRERDKQGGGGGGGGEGWQWGANVSLMEKPCGWFLLAKCLKNTCGRVTF